MIENKFPTIIHGIFLSYYPSEKGKIIINSHIHVDKFKLELNKYVDSAGYCPFVIISKTVKDKHNNDFSCILNTYKPTKDKNLIDNGIKGVFLKNIGSDKGKTIIDIWIDRDKFVMAMDMLVNENGYVSFKIERDVLGNSLVFLLNPHKPKKSEVI